MDTGKKQKRNRLIALSFASVLLLLIFGPLADWFIGADRFLYDQVASHLPNRALNDAVIISIDPARNSNAEVVEQYGLVLEQLRKSDVKRIIMANPPEIAAADALPDWANSLRSDVPIYVPARHRFAELTPYSGFVDVHPDSDNILRRSELWQLNNSAMTPSLALSIAFDDDETQSSHRMSSAEDAIYLSNY